LTSEQYKCALQTLAALPWDVQNSNFSTIAMISVKQLIFQSFP